MIKKLSKVGKDKEAWKKGDEYPTQLQDDDHMLTLEDTDTAIMRAEEFLHRNETEEAGPKDNVKVASAADVETSTTTQDDKLAVMVAKNETLQAQLKKQRAPELSVRGTGSQ